MAAESTEASTATATMRAVVLVKPTEDGGEYTCAVSSSVPVREPGAGQVRVRTMFASVNPVDAKANWWHALLPPTVADPCVLGVDGAGVVDAVGAGVTNFRVGDRVVAHLNLLEGNGSFAEFFLATAAAVCAIPDGVGFAEAAALPCASWTAYKAVAVKLGAASKAGKSIVVTAGSGAVGGAAVQLSKHFGLAPIVATCSGAKADAVRARGATHTIDYRTEDVAARIKEILPAGADLAVDSVSPDSVNELFTALGFDGEIATIAGVVKRGFEGDSYLKSISVHDVCLGPAAYMPGRPEQLAEYGAKVFELFQAGALDPMIADTIDLDALPSELEFLATGRSRGKLVVRIASDASS